MNNNFEKEMELAINKILQSKNIYIASHVQPDGDNLGSTLALGLALKKIKDSVFILKVDETPADFLFLPGIDTVKDFEVGNEIDLFIALDTGDIDRLGKNKNLINLAKTVINIDHHVSNTNFGNINIVDSKASATAELIYKLIAKMNIPMDKEIATCLYTGISTDTGSFMYDNTSSETHEIVAELINHDIDKKGININLYQNRSIDRTKLFIKTLGTLDMYFDDQVAVVKVTNEMLEETNTTMEDTEGIISFVRATKNVEVAVILKEVSINEIKASIRSKRFVDVSEICLSFNGGGHKRAAGCTINEPIQVAKELLLNEIKKVF